MKIFCYAFLTLLLSQRNGVAQVGAKPDEASSNSQPLRERTLDENEFFRVSRLEVPPGKVASIGSQKRDLIVIAKLLSTLGVLCANTYVIHHE